MIHLITFDRIIAAIRKHVQIVHLYFSTLKLEEAKTFDKYHKLVEDIFKDKKLTDVFIIGSSFLSLEWLKASSIHAE